MSIIREHVSELYWKASSRTKMTIRCVSTLSPSEKQLGLLLGDLVTFLFSLGKDPRVQ